MSKTMEEIYREAKEKAKKSNSSNATKNNQYEDDYYMSLAETEPPKIFSSTLSSPQEQDDPKWYEKTWLIAILILFVFPVGLIWLWSVGRYSRNVKVAVTVIVAFLVFIGQTGENSYNKSSVYNKTSTQSNSVGYLRQGATWEDDSGKSHMNSNRVKVEVTGNTIVMSDGSKRVQIYFLEGRNAGSWGYVNSSSLSR